MGHSRHLFLRCTLYDDCTWRKTSFMSSLSLPEFHGPERIGRRTTWTTKNWKLFDQLGA